MDEKNKTACCNQAVSEMFEKQRSITEFAVTVVDMAAARNMPIRDLYAAIDAVRSFIEAQKVVCYSSIKSKASSV